jgi:repressor LexA
VENQLGKVQVNPNLFSPRADYLLRVRGNSMVDAGILDGDLLAVHKTADARSGQIVVARLDDEVTVKRLRRHRGGRIELIAENPDYGPVPVEGREFAIEGIAVGLIRNGKFM